MARTFSTMRMKPGSRAPAFRLPDTGGRTVSLDDVPEGKPLLVAFLCNHCPFVKHVLDGFVGLAGEYGRQGVRVVAISSNDAAAYPEDSPEKMAGLAREKALPFPYLYDESQEVARAYGASCTPDFFLFDGDRRLFYRGRLDGSRPGNGVPVTGEDLSGAVRRVLAGEPPPTEQQPSLGCNIKWKPGNEPDYSGASS